jgi:ATP-dependent 26S proteasome regulatory subunit
MAKKKSESSEEEAMNEISVAAEKAEDIKKAEEAGEDEVEEEEEEIVAIKVAPKTFQLIQEHKESNSFIVWDESHAKEDFYVTNLKTKMVAGKFGQTMVGNCTRILPEKKKTVVMKFGVPQSLQTQLKELGMLNTPENTVLRIYYAGKKNFQGTDFQSFFVEIIQQ